jgi:hypothetical protein
MVPIKSDPYLINPTLKIVHSCCKESVIPNFKIPQAVCGKKKKKHVFYKGFKNTKHVEP